MSESETQDRNSGSLHGYFAVGMIGFAIHGLMLMQDKLSATGYAITIALALCQLRRRR